VLYRLVMAIPTSDIRMTTLGKSSTVSGKTMAKVSLLGSGEQLKWKQENDALLIDKPSRMPCDYVLAFKIEFVK
jgi:alpha-L-fucosidase